VNVEKVIEPDGVSIKVLKILGDASIRSLKDLFNKLNRGKKDWRLSFIVPLF
jgi:hypothetical protein